MVLGTLIALLLAQLGGFMRLLITTGLVLVWAMPLVVAVNIWNWMVDYEFGVVNWTLAHLGLSYFDHHDWFVNPLGRASRDRARSSSGARSRSSRSRSTRG